MANKKSTESGVRKLTKMGGKSLGVTLPIDLVRSLGWREKQNITVKKKNGALVIRDAKAKAKSKKKKAL